MSLFKRAEKPAEPAEKDVEVVQFNDAGEPTGTLKVEKVAKSDDEWRSQLTPEQFAVARQAGTERAFTGKYYDLHDDGIFRCVCCGNALFRSDSKFDSGTGWPSFTDPIASQNIKVRTDNAYGMRRTEVLCAKCDAHLGHVFEDGPGESGLRYCMNSASLNFVKPR